MDRNKAKLLTFSTMLMMGAIGWMTWRNSINAWRVLEAFFAAYGFWRFGCDLYRWMQMPARARETQGRRARG